MAVERSPTALTARRDGFNHTHFVSKPAAGTTEARTSGSRSLCAIDLPMARSSPGRNGPRILQLSLTRQNDPLKLVIYGEQMGCMLERDERRSKHSVRSKN
jgi:hypothetical protein